MTNVSCKTGWCGKNDKPAVFKKQPIIICYNKAKSTQINKAEYDEKRYNCLNGTTTQSFIVPRKSAKAWTMQPGELCRIKVVEGSQVGDLNLWNLDNYLEKFYSGKTRQLHSAHLTTYDRLWSSLPYLRPMATIVADSLAKYGIDEDGAACHDVIGTRCDNHTLQLITGESAQYSCHQALTAAIKDYGLTELDVHDVWNVFMCTGFTKDSHQYFCKASPARNGDYVEIIADMPLLLALSACPQGDVSTPVGASVPENLCHPLSVEVFTSATKSNTDTTKNEL